MNTPSPPFDPYARIAEFYDLEHDGFDDDIDFYLNSIRVVGDPVLEAGCGTGRLLRPIAAAGFRVTGLDQSTAMLDRAKASLDVGADGLATLYVGAMDELEFAPGGPFGTVIFSLNGLLHLANPAAQRRALSSTKQALDPRGQLLVDVLNPTFEALRAFDGSVLHEGTWKGHPGGSVEKFSSRRLTQSEQLIHSKIWYDITSGDGSFTRIGTEFDQRYLYRHELELMLELAGFANWQVYGSYELDPFDDTSDRLIIAAEVSAV
jgi:SAM-dependent methyltransferase